MMLDHNYLYKAMIEKICQVDIAGSSSHQLFVEVVEAANHVYSAYQQNYLHEHFKKLGFLPKLKYPCTVVYPLGNRLYNISLRKPLLIQVLSRNDKHQFEDSLQTIENLLSKNSKVLSDRDTDPRDWWNIRDRVNRSISKLTDQLDIGYWDVCFQPRNEGKIFQKALKAALSATQMTNRSELDHHTITKIISRCMGCSISDQSSLSDFLINLKKHQGFTENTSSNDSNKL